jgi:NTE family protein
MNTRAGSDGMAGSPRLGLVLCGGGVRGLAHAGVLRALEQARLRPHVLVGVSMGAIVAATYALNPDWYRDLHRLPERPLPMPILAPTERPGLINRLILAQRTLSHMFVGWGIGEEAVGWARGTLDELTLGRRLEEADPRVIVTATDLAAGQRVALRSGPATDALYASAALAGIVPPALRGEAMLADGGYADLAPLDLARDAGADVVIAVDVASGAPEVRPTNGVSAMLRSFEICQNHHARLRLAEADLVIRPVFRRPIDTLEIACGRDAIAAGIAAARRALPRLGALGVRPRSAGTRPLPASTAQTSKKETQR